jgi:hypothetical protein
MSQYPSSFDTDVDIPRIEDNITESGAETINALRSAIFNLQRALGTNPQGSANDLNTRISQSLNQDGTLKTAALILTGIVNSDVATNAAIAESKLDLDVATQFLQDQVTSNDIDIAELQESIAQIISNFARHVAGTAFNHDSFDIFLDKSYPVSTPPAFTDLTATNVGDALIETNTRFLDHASMSKINAHLAANIGVDGANFRSISVNVDDVQEALEELDNARNIELIKHRDHLHANGFDNWANNIDGYNKYLQLVPATYGSSTIAQIIPGTNNQIRFDGLNLAALGVVQGSVVVILNGDASGQYIVDDVGPRSTIGIKPSLNQDEVEVSSAIINAGLILDGYVEAQIFGQSSLFTFKSNVSATFHQSSSTLDSVQLSRPNAAKVITLGLKPHLISGSEQLDLEVGVGSGSTRTLSITSLDEDRIGPVSSVTVDTIVDRINSLFQGSSAFPASAYRVGDELCISHNWDESKDYYIKVLNSSAATVLGFDGYGADILDKEIYPTHMSKFYINGYEHTKLPTIVEDSASASGTTITFDTVNPSAAGVKVGHLIHVINHATASERGTYFVTSVSSSSVTVHDSVSAGPINVTVIHDAIPLHEMANTSNSLIFQCFFDSSAKANYNIRSSYDKTITNLDVVDISDNFLAGTYSLSSSIATGGHLLQLDAGVEVFVPTGFLGQKIVYGDSNVEWIAVNIVGALSTGVAEVVINKHIDEEEVLEICSVMSNGLETLLNVRDKRLFGSIGQDELREDVIQNYIENPLLELRSNGVVKGFDVINSNEVDPVYPAFEGVLIRGGTAYVDGVRNDVRTSVVILDNLAGTFYICLNKLGNYVIINDNDFNLSDIISGHAGSVLPIAEVTHNGTSITSALDRRYFINNLDAKVDLIADLTNHMIGSFSTFEAAIAFANNYTADEKFFIRVTSRTTNPLTIPSGSRDLTIELDGYVGSLYVNSNCVVRSRSLTQRGTSHVQQGIFVNTGCTKVELAGLSVLGSVDFLGAESLQFVAKDCVFENTITFANENMSFGFFQNCVFNDSLTDSVNVSSILDLDFINCIFNGNVLELPASANVVRFSECTFNSTGLYDENSVELFVDLCKFVSFNGTTSFVSVSGKNTVFSSCLFSNSTFTGTNLVALDIDADSAIFSNCVFDNITIPNSMKLLVINNTGIISDCIFENITNASDATHIVEAAQISGCSAQGITGEMSVKVVHIFSDNVGIHNVNVGPSGSLPGIVSNNVFPSTTVFGSNVILNSSSESQCIINSNTFLIASNGIGIQFAGSTKNVKIANNSFKCFDDTGVCIELGSASNVIVSSNTFENGKFIANDAATSNLIFTQNIANGNSISAVSVIIGDQFVFSGNQIDGYVEFSGASVESVTISENVLKGGVNLSAELNRSSIINNVVGTELVSSERYDDDIFHISSSIFDTIISKNHCIFSGDIPVTFDGVTFSENIGGLQVSTSPNITWKNSIVSQNKFLQVKNNFADEFKFTIYSDILNTPSNVLILSNEFRNPMTVITSANTVFNFCFDGNYRGITDVLFSFYVSFETSINYSIISGNLDFCPDFGWAQVSVDNSIISENVSRDGFLGFWQTRINNTIVSDNICDNIEMIGESVSGLTISNNIMYSYFNFATAYDNDFTGVNIYGNQAPQIFIGSDDTNNYTYSITKSKIEANICNEFSIFPKANEDVVCVFTDNLISANRINGDLTFLSQDSFYAYDNPSNNFSNNSFSNNYINGQLLFYGGSSYTTDNILIKNTLISQNIVRNSIRFESFAVFNDLIISQNQIYSQANQGIVFLQKSVNSPTLLYRHNNVIISANVISNTNGTGISISCGSDGLPTNSRFNNLSIVNNHMLNMNISIVNASQTLSGDFVFSGLNISNNYLRSVYVANNSGVNNVDILFYGVSINNNAFAGDLSDTGIHAGRFFNPGVNLYNNHETNGQLLLLWSSINGNRSSNIAEPFDIKLVRDGLGGSGDVAFTGCSIDSNLSCNIMFKHPGNTAAISGFYRCSISHNRNGSLDVDDITYSGTTAYGRIQDTQIVANHFDFALGDLRCYERVAMFCNTGTFTHDAGKVFDTGSLLAKVFPWGNIGSGADARFNGSTTRTVSSTNDDTAIVC